ncbi:MAG: aldo/keto reductase [Steroidobacteraceae bacterium]|jgi:aryl-alcohol dehydrogenase-like predicted oxidoreductase
MDSRPLGKTGVEVSALGLGCMGLIGWYGQRNDEEARATLLAALDAGITHFDTASSYQQGENERFVGAALKSAPQYRRERLFIASKFGLLRDPSGGVLLDNKPESLVSAVDASLARLGLDYIDLYYLHRIDPAVPIEESVGALARLVATGKIRHIGLSECSSSTLRRACAVHPIAAVQSEYSLWVRDPEAGMLATCREFGVGFVAYSPLGRGFLAGDFSSFDQLPANDVRRQQPRFQAEALAHNRAIAEALNRYAAARGCTTAQLALAWLLAQGEDILPIPGTKHRARLMENIGALSVRLSVAEAAEVAALVSTLGIQGERHPPGMMQVLNG